MQHVIASTVGIGAAQKKVFGDLKIQLHKLVSFSS